MVSIYHLLHNGAKIPNWQLELDLPDMAHVESTQALEMQQSKLQKAYRAHRQMQAVQNVNKRSRFDGKTFSNPEDSEEGSIQSKLQYLQSLNFTKIVAA